MAVARVMGSGRRATTFPMSLTPPPLAITGRRTEEGGARAQVLGGVVLVPVLRVYDWVAKLILTVTPVSHLGHCLRDGKEVPVIAAKATSVVLLTMK